MHNGADALSLFVSACSCVQTSKVLFVLLIYKELQPGQVNSYTAFDWLNGGIISLVLAMKHNFVVFSFFSDVYIRVDKTSPKLTFKLLNKLCC